MSTPAAVIAITDPTDERVDDLRDLNSSDRRPDLPGGKGLVIAEGVFTIERLFASRFTPHIVLGTAAKLAELQALGYVPTPACPFFAVTPEVLAGIAGFDMHRGIVAAAHRAPALDPGELIASARTLIVLEGLGDHENIGAIFRSAAGLGVDGILFGAGCADPLYRRVVRVSMGHVLRLPFAHLDGTRTTWQRQLRTLQDSGFQLISLTPDPAAVPLWEAMHGEKVALLLGAEGPGLTEHAMRATDLRARIPMAPGTDSLNVATAGAIALYERARVLATR